MTRRGPIAIFMATSAVLAAYLFPYFYLPGAWWRAIPCAAVILLTGALFFGRDMPRTYGLRMSWKELAASAVLFAALLPFFSYAISHWVVVEPLRAESSRYPLAQVHQFFQVFNDEVMLRAVLLTILLGVISSRTAVVLLPAVLFAIGHHVVYRTGSVGINWTAMVSIFAFAAIANTLFIRYRHIGYGFALHYAWNCFRFNSRYYLDGVALSEGASFNFIEGNLWVTGLSFLLAVLVFERTRTVEGGSAGTSGDDC